MTRTEKWRFGSKDVPFNMFLVLLRFFELFFFGGISCGSTSPEILGPLLKDDPGKQDIIIHARESFAPASSLGHRTPEGFAQCPDKDVGC